MRLSKTLVVVAILLIPVLTLGEVIYLKDGSTIKGKISAIEADTLYVDTDYGQIRIPKDKVLRIDYSDSGAGPPAGPNKPGYQSSEPGTLSVTFDRFTVTSRIIMDRRDDKKEFEKVNAIKQVLLVDGLPAYSHTDTTTDKIAYRGNERVLRNDMSPKPFKLGLPPGPHRCQLDLQTVGATDENYRFQDDPVEETVVIGNIDIAPGSHFDLRIGYRKKKWGLAGHELFVYTAPTEARED